MPGMRCTVGACNNSFIKTKSAGLNITYHKFPVNEKIRKLWVQRCYRRGEWNPSSCHVCSIHFSEDDYRTTKSASHKKRLKEDAVPSLYLRVPPEIPFAGKKGKKNIKRNKYEIKKYPFHELKKPLTFNVNIGNCNSVPKTCNNVPKTCNNVPNLLVPRVEIEPVYHPPMQRVTEEIETERFPAFKEEQQEEIYEEENYEEENMEERFRAAEYGEVRNREEETYELKYSELLENPQQIFVEMPNELSVKAAATQTENDRILETCNMLVHKNLQLETKIKELERKLNRLENYVQNL